MSTTSKPTEENFPGVVAAAPAANLPTEEAADVIEEVIDLANLPEAAPSAEKPKTRDEIRAKIFSAKPKFELVEDFYGTDIELRQPDLETALQARNAEENEHVFTMLLDYAYVPGTNEKVFEEADVEAIRALPFGPEMANLLGKVNKLLGIDGEAIAEMLKDATKST